MRKPTLYSETAPDDFLRDAEFRNHTHWLIAEGMLLLHDGKALDAVQTDALAFSLDMNEAHYLAWIRRIHPLIERPYPESLAGIQVITREAAQNEADPDYNLAAQSIETWEKLPGKRALYQANVEILQTAAPLLAWKIQHGHFPESLDECLKSVPQDPFDLRPLRYRKEGEGFVLYSIGESGKFDGGQATKRPAPDETIFRYPRPVYTTR